MTIDGAGSDSDGSERDRGSRIAIAFCVTLGLIYFVTGLLSAGTHNDDDIGRFLNVRDAIRYPEHFLSRWNRPAFVLVYLLPAQVGYWAVELVTAILSAATCYLTYGIAREYRERYAILAIPFLGFQPFFFGLSFSALAEPLAAFLLAASLYLLATRKNVLAAILAATIPLARLELGILLALWTGLFVRRRAWSAILILPAGILLWNLAGFLATGDGFYLLNAVFQGEERVYESVAYDHYLRGYIFVVGPVVFALSVVGIVESIRRRELELVWIGTLVMMAAFTWLSTASSAGQAAGFLRHLVGISPFFALLAVRGFDRVVSRDSMIPAATLLAAVVVCWRFLSVDLVSGYLPGEEPEYVKLAFVALVAFGGLLWWRLPGLFPGRASFLLVPSLAVLCSIETIRQNPIIESTNEQRAIEQAANVCKDLEIADRTLLCNHGWLRFFLGTDSPPRERRLHLTKEHLETAPIGSVAVWEGHYSHRLNGDVDVEYMEKELAYRVEARTEDSGFFAVVLSKTTSDGYRGDLSPDRYVHSGLGIEWDLSRADGWNFRPEDDGSILLTGRHANGVSIRVGLSRFFRLSNPELFHVRLEQNLRKLSANIGETVSDQGRSWIWGSDANQEFVFVIDVVSERSAALVASAYFPGEKREWVRAELSGLLAGLRLER